MILNLYAFIILFLLYVNLNAQNFISNKDNTVIKIYTGFINSLGYTDIPILVGYLLKDEIYNIGIRNKLTLTPSTIDKSISINYGSEKNNSLGSMDKDIIPKYIFWGRLGILSVADLLFDTQITDNSFKQVFLYEKSIIYTYTITEIVKNSIKRTRPDKSDNRSFFSGHTSTAFASSTFLFCELNNFYNNWHLTKYNKTLRTAFKATSFTVLYGWASYVGYSRINDKKHYLSDVLAAAAVGTAVSYFVYTAFNTKNDLINLNLEGGANSFYFSYRVGL